MPTTQAVMFCLMDVSGSMDEARKELCQALLHPALPVPDPAATRRSSSSSSATTPRRRRWTRRSFFHSTETGGTVVSSALGADATRSSARRYASGQWNIYGAQASDGDNWDNDSADCRELLAERDPAPGAVLRLCRDHRRRAAEPVGRIHQAARPRHRNFAMQHIRSAGRTSTRCSANCSRRHLA